MTDPADPDDALTKALVDFGGPGRVAARAVEYLLRVRERDLLAGTASVLDAAHPDQEKRDVHELIAELRSIVYGEGKTPGATGEE